jgi:hypothetical protein
MSKRGGSNPNFSGASGTSRCSAPPLKLAFAGALTRQIR